MNCLTFDIEHIESDLVICPLTHCRIEAVLLGQSGGNDRSKNKEQEQVRGTLQGSVGVEPDENEIVHEGCVKDMRKGGGMAFLLWLSECRLAMNEGSVKR